eukprot:scaffold17299_cov38-Prasinocladus_malaysianus.AAC.1
MKCIGCPAYSSVYTRLPLETTEIAGARCRGRQFPLGERRRGFRQERRYIVVADDIIEYEYRTDNRASLT